MSGAAAIFWKELRVYFVSPLAYAFLVVFLFLSGLFFYMGIAVTGEASLRVMMGNMAVSLMFLLPMLTMRHFAEEQKRGTFELLMTSPISLPGLIFGKWLASLALCTIMLAGTFLYPAILAYYGEPDWGIIWTTYLGLWLCCGAFCAAGLFSSSLTDDAVAGGMAGVLLLLPFWLLGSVESFGGEALSAFFERLALLPHLRSFSQGVVDTADLAYFAGFIAIFLFLTYRKLESRRWR
ncbi:MAG: ABC transporter permease [Myxococcota bacterium]|nr:ABC transporter permease [Myxococcota bacterium]